MNAIDLKRTGPVDYRPPIRPGLVVIASPYRGYSPYLDVERNLDKAGEILATYWRRDIPAISLVRQWSFLGPVGEDDYESHFRAQEWCLTIIRRADEVHFHYPAGRELTRGMLAEWDLAWTLGIKCREFTWREW